MSRLLSLKSSLGGTLLPTGTSEVDPMKILMDLDIQFKHYKSVGNLVEYIYYLGVVIKTFPYPVIVNTVVSKLIELFRHKKSDTILRKEILNVFSEEDVSDQLFMVSNVDHVLSILTLHLSNDPVARSLTLLTLGKLHVITHDKVELHHALRQSLRSKYRIEVESAIHAILDVSPYSPNLCYTLLENDIIELLEDGKNQLDMDNDLKLMIIKILSKMSHDVTLTEKSWNISMRLLEVYHHTDFQRSIINSITNLICSSGLFIKKHSLFLYDRFLHDPRYNVRICSIKNLRKIYSLGMNPLSKDVLTSLFDLLNFEISDPKDITLSYSILDLILYISNKSYITLEEYQQQFNVLQTLMHHPSYQISVISLKILITAHIRETERFGTNNFLRINSLTLMNGSLLLFFKMINEDISTSFLMKVLINLCMYSEDEITTTMIMSLLPLSRTLVSPQKKSIIYSFVAKVVKRKRQLIFPFLYDIMEEGTQLLDHARNAVNETDAKVILQTVVLITKIVLYINAPQKIISTFVNEAIQSLFNCSSYWHLYQIGKDSLITGYPQFSKSIFGFIKTLVQSESTYFWMQALEYFSGDSSSTSDLHRGIIALRATRSSFGKMNGSSDTSTNEGFTFQIDYVQLEIDFKNIVNQARVIIESEITSSSDSNIEARRISNVSHMFLDLGNKYIDIIKSYFNIDDHSIAYLCYRAQLCIFIFYMFESFDVEKYATIITNPKNQDMYSLMILSFTEYLEEYIPLYFISKYRASLLEMVNEFCSILEISDILSISAARRIGHILKRIHSRIFEYPPLFFHQTSTKVDLTITPIPKYPGEPILVKTNTDIVLTISGKFKIKKCKRSVKKVQISVCNSKSPDKILTIEVKPTSNSFTTTCIWPGQIETKIKLLVTVVLVDQSHHHWQGPQRNLDLVFSE